jgi:hypothetical protein
LVLKLDGGETLAQVRQSARPTDGRFRRRGVVALRRQGFNETPDRFLLLRAQVPDYVFDGLRLLRHDGLFQHPY